jgi:hypothetical protein
MLRLLDRRGNDEARLRVGAGLWFSGYAVLLSWRQFGFAGAIAAGAVESVLKQLKGSGNKDRNLVAR